MKFLKKITSIGKWRLIAVVFIVVVGVFVVSLFLSPGSEGKESLYVHRLQKTDSSVNEITKVVANPLTPVRIIIPSAEVDANVVALGVNSTGHMAVPKDFDNVAWYRLGYKPGELGHAVFAGHVDDGRGTPAVFDQLRLVSPGDTFSIVGDDGRAFTYRVTSKYKYEYWNAPLTDIFGKSDKPTATIITCAGKWLDLKRSYADRLIIFGVLVSTSTAKGSSSD